MHDEEKTKQPLIEDLAAMRQRIAELESDKARQQRTIGALRESARRYRGAFEHAIDGFALHDIVLDDEGDPIDYVFREVNTAFETLTGLDADTILGKRATEVLPGIEEAPFIDLYGRVALTGEPIRFEQYSAQLDRTYDISAYSPQRGQFVTLFAEVTEHKEMEAKLREREARLRQIIESTPAGYFYIDRDYRFQKVNAAWLRMHGYDDPADIIGKHFSITQKETDLEAAVRNVDRLLQGEPIPSGEFTRRRKDGSTGYHIFSARPVLESGDVIGLEGFLIDVTERKQAEAEREEALKALQASQARITSIFDAAPIGIGLVSDRVLLDVNDRICEMMGYTRDELIGTNARILYPSDEDYEFVGREKYQQIHSQGTGTVETRFQRKDGQILDILLSSTPLDTEDLSTGVTFTALDITERKRMEKQLRRQEQLAAVGQLAGGIAHDFRNLLAAIILYAEMDRTRSDLPPDVVEHFDVIIGESHKATDLVQQILDFSSQAMIRREPLDLASFIKDVVDRVLRRTIPENIALVLETQYAGALDRPFTVRADPGRIQQALINLALNARDAIEGAGELRFALSRIEILPDDTPPVADMPPGLFVRLTVADSGVGMSAEVQSHLFEPFFTTKDVGQGTGLGLAQVFGIVRQHGGYIDVETAVDAGTAFHVYLPWIDVPPEQTRDDRADRSPVGRGETILFVEDDPRIRKAVRDGLSALNYRVLTAANGRDALAHKSLADVDLVLTDMVMPEMGGKALLRALKTQTPDLKVIAMTGYVTEVDARTLVSAGFSGVITKPFSIEELATGVRDVLDSR